MSELWNAGDKVELTGEGWEPSDGLTPGDVVTLERAIEPGVWQILEGNRDNNGGPLRVWENPNDLFGGRLVSSLDVVNHPPHYTQDPSGVECIQITRHRNFNVGNAIKYLWRNGLKDSENPEKQIEDLRKAIFYINDEIERLTNER